MSQRRPAVNYHGNAHVPSSSVYSAAHEMYETLQHALPALEQLENQRRLESFVKALRSQGHDLASIIEGQIEVTEAEMAAAHAAHIFAQTPAYSEDFALNYAAIENLARKTIRHNHFVNKARGNRYNTELKKSNPRGKEVDDQGLFVHRPEIPYRKKGTGELNSGISESIPSVPEQEIHGYLAAEASNDSEFRGNGNHSTIHLEDDEKMHPPKYIKNKKRAIARLDPKAHQMTRQARDRLRQINAWIDTNHHDAFYWPG